MTDEQDFLKDLLAMFKIESEEHIKEISTGLLKLEKTPMDEIQSELIETIYREAHSLKGAARAVNLMEVETLCQSLESVFALIKKQAINIESELFDVLHHSVDLLPELIAKPGELDISETMQRLTQLEKEGAGQPTEEETEILDVPDEKKEKKTVEKSDPKKDVPIIKESINPGEQKITAPPVIEKPASPTVLKLNDKAFISDTIRVSTRKLDSILLQAEEMLAAKLSARQQAMELKSILMSIDSIKKEWDKHTSDIRWFRHYLEKTAETGQDTQSVYQSMNLLDFVERNQDQVRLLEDRIDPLVKISELNVRQLGGMIDHMLEDMKKVLMLPFSTMLKLLPKIVRDLSRDQAKDVELVVRGSTTEIDRRILEEMKDPFVHLLRNCIDHGIEKPDERVRKRKTKSGTITISITQMSSGMLEILIGDDGYGVDPEKVIKVAIKQGLVNEAEVPKMTDAEKLAMIFQSDLSTSPIITDISGRGLGLAIVREKVENLGGTITLKTTVGQGTTFRIVLPITLATFRGILVEICGQTFVLPTSSVERVTRIKPDIIKTVENKETIIIDEEAVSLVRLEQVLGVSREGLHQETPNYIQIIVLSQGDKRIAFTVDEILNEQEVLVKGLGKQLSRVQNVAGSTILGSGKVVPILNISDLLKTAIIVASTRIQEVMTEEEQVVKKSILIAEDSITSRTLLRNILESAGYKVRTTVDGADAFSALKEEQFDLIVTDLEMPRMSGFELVSKVRKNKRTSELPIVLVTGLESKEDRERGIDVGANAYIVKRSFDQSNLLNVVRKLI